MTDQGPQTQQPSTVIVSGKKGPGCLLQILWFLFIGWWLGALLIIIAWLLNITIIGLPLGLTILNNIPKYLALQEPRNTIQAVTSRGTTLVSETKMPQLNFWLRAIYFLLVGWWWSGIWLVLAYLLCGTIILIPVGLEMFHSTPAMTTLKRY